MYAIRSYYDAGDDQSDAYVYSGFITVTDIDSSYFTVELSGPLTNVYSGGSDRKVSWTWADGKLTGSVGNATVATIETGDTQQSDIV